MRDAKENHEKKNGRATCFSSPGFHAATFFRGFLSRHAPRTKRKRRRLPFNPKFRNFRNGDKWYGNFLGKVTENPEIVEFPKSESFNRKFLKFRDESQKEQKFPGKLFRKFGYTSRGCPFFRNLCKFPIFYSALASSFGRDHSKLDISHKGDRDCAFDKRNTLEPFYLYVDKY